MIQYSRALVMDREAATYWIPALRGYDGTIFCGLCSNHEPKNSLNAFAVASGFSSVRK
jgi:hypothetical protein